MAVICLFAIALLQHFSVASADCAGIFCNFLDTSSSSCLPAFPLDVCISNGSSADGGSVSSSKYAVDDDGNGVVMWYEGAECSGTSTTGSLNTGECPGSCTSVGDGDECPYSVTRTYVRSTGTCTEDYHEKAIFTDRCYPAGGVLAGLSVEWSCSGGTGTQKTCAGEDCSGNCGTNSTDSQDCVSVTECVTVSGSRHFYTFPASVCIALFYVVIFMFDA